MAQGLREQLLGSTIGGCRIDEAIGGGAMGFVFKARHIALDKIVALKVLMPELRASQELRERFIREARIASAIEHPNVVPIYGTGETGEYQYIVMQYLEGVALGRVLSRQGIDPLLALRVGEQIASALSAVHRRSIVHRDIKPENVIVTRGGHVYLTDFGVACAFGESSPPGRGGSPAYMSPEQCRGEPLDGRSDFYSLGVMLYVMLTGRRPFLGSTTASLMLMHQQDGFPPIRSLRPEIPQRLADCVESLLAKHPAQRPTHAEDLLAELDQLQEELRAGRRRDSLSVRRKAADSRDSAFGQLVDSGSDEEREELEDDVEGIELGLLSLGADSADTGTKRWPDNRTDNFPREDLPHSRRHAATLAALHKAVEERPQDSSLHRSLGNIYRRARDAAAAERHYRRALELDASDRSALTSLGALLRGQGRASEAESLLKRAVALDPGSVEARIALGKVYERAGASGLARQEYQSAVDAVPADERGYVALASLLIGQGKHTSAKGLLETARELHPTFAPTLFWLSAVLAKEGDTDTALELLERAVKAGLRDRRRIVSLNEFSALREHWRFRALLDALRGLR